MQASDTNDTNGGTDAVLTPTVSPGVIYKLAWHHKNTDDLSYTLTSHRNSLTDFSLVSSLHELNTMAESIPR